MTAHFIPVDHLLAIPLFPKISLQIGIRERADIRFSDIVTQAAADRQYIGRLIGRQPGNTCRKTGYIPGNRNE